MLNWRMDNIHRIVKRMFRQRGNTHRDHSFWEISISLGVDRSEWITLTESIPQQERRIGNTPRFRHERHRCHCTRYKHWDSLPQSRTTHVGHHCTYLYCSWQGEHSHCPSLWQATEQGAMVLGGSEYRSKTDNQIALLLAALVAEAVKTSLKMWYCRLYPRNFTGIYASR